MTDIVTKLRQYAENDMRVEEVCLAAAIEIERLRKALYEIYDLDGDLNMGNYTDDDVRALNNAFIETYYIARDALEGK